jgi:cytochrome oxidase Cu insertion factor (SCO1/SenC/PrrC family)
MAVRQILALGILCLFLLGPVEAYKGSQLARGPIEGFHLTDHTEQPYSFDFDSEGVVVVSFIFTRCPDVCPVITQSLKSVDGLLTDREREDVTFVSITVDPEHDSPTRLAEYAELHGVDWPHLTGTVEELEPVWATFGVVVQNAVIEAHVADYQPAESSVTLAGTESADGQYMFNLNATGATELFAEEKNWSLNTSLSSFGTMLHGLHGVDAPQDGEWYWELNVWNQTTTMWEPSPVGMDDVDALQNPHIAWAASSANRSNLTSPSSDQALSMTVLWPNGSEEIMAHEHLTAYHLTRGVLESAAINNTVESTAWGHYLSSLDDVAAPSNASWWWSLLVWNETEASWGASEVGMDGLTQPGHIAWAPSSTNASTLPSPVATETDEDACNGHGWVMGSGDGMHCMCDSGYTWAENDRLSCVSETSEEYTVGHSTIVYILNPAREPVVAWAGEDWRPEDVAADIQELLEKESLGGYEPEVTPSVPTITVLGAWLVAVLVLQRRLTSSNP